MKPRRTAIIETLRKRLAAGYYDRRSFPSERALAKEFSVSYMTARQAVLRLVEEGLILREGRSTLPNPALSQPARKEFLFVVPNWANPGYWLWYPVLEKAVARVGGSLRFIVYENWSDPVIYRTFQEPSDGIFLFLYPDVPDVILRLLEKRRGQIATIGDDYTELGIALLDHMPDNGVELLVQHLEDLGHTRVDCFNSEPHTKAELRRVEAWKDALTKHGLEGSLIDHPATPGTDALVVAYEAAMQRLRNGPGLPSAIFCTSARGALGLSRACYDLNHTVGTQISLCTLGTYDNCRYLTPSLTCLVTPDLGIFADRAVQFMLSPGESRQPSIRFQPQSAEIYFGESTGPVLHDKKASRRTTNLRRRSSSSHP